ncbi:DUF1858 domain-containing protein [Candidatus Fermentibacteria bacterium]|nr:DUF1858 domain-containing protein [Candidatus Fermentibacteria bacterium]
MVDSAAQELPITAETPIQWIVDTWPEAMHWLLQRGVVCVQCGDPFWGSLGELLSLKGVEDPERLIFELNRHVAGGC